MAQNSALATAGNELVDASTLLELTVPAEPSAPSEVVTPKQPSAPPKGLVRVGSEDLTPEQASAKLTALQAEISALKPKAEVGQLLENIGATYGQDAVMHLVRQAELIEEHGGVPQEEPGDSWLVSPIDVPDDAPTPTPFKWAEADDDIRYLYAHTEARSEALNDRLNDVLKIVKGIQSQLGAVTNQTAEHQLVAHLQTLGVPATLETVKAMRAKGIEPSVAMKDPAMLQWMRSAHKAKPAPVQAAPPEAPGPTGENILDLDDNRLTIPQKLQKLSEGAVPFSKDPETLESFKRLMEQYGIKAA